MLFRILTLLHNLFIETHLPKSFAELLVMFRRDGSCLLLLYVPIPQALRNITNNSALFGQARNYFGSMQEQIFGKRMSASFSTTSVHGRLTREVQGRTMEEEN